MKRYLSSDDGLLRDVVCEGVVHDLETFNSNVGDLNSIHLRERVVQVEDELVVHFV